METGWDDYTGEDLRRFRVVLQALQNGDDVAPGLSLPFVVRGWLEVMVEAPGLRLTDMGRRILE